MIAAVMRWFETRTLEQPTFVVSGRFGQSVMFVSYDRLLKRWFWLQPYGVEERIEEPEMIFVDEKWACQHLLEKPRPKLFKPVKLRRKQRAQQLALDL